MPAGTLSATSAGGVAVGGTSAALTLTGTVADINAFIANAAQGVTYAPVPGSTTDATLTVTSNDNGNTGIGGAQTDTDTVTLDLVAQNDAPTATITPTSYNATEQTNLKLHGTGLSIADVDAGSNAISITLSVTQGILTVTAGNSGVNSVSGSPSSSVTVTGTIAEINNLLGGIDRTSGPQARSSTTPMSTIRRSATLTFLVDDTGDIGAGGPLTATDIATINIAPVNDAPATDLNGGAGGTGNNPSFTEQTPVLASPLQA